MIPAIGTLSIHRYTDYRQPSNQNISDLSKTYSQSKIRTEKMPVGDELKRLLLLKEQCKICWRWLTSLHNRIRQNSSYLPGIPLGMPGTNYRNLFIAEQTKLEEMIAREIDENYHLIWLAKSIEELEIIADRLAEQRNVP
jgi:hypothetical protein